MNTACLVLVIFGLHITKFSIKFQQCAFSLHNPRPYLLRAADLHHVAPHSFEIPPCQPVPIRLRGGPRARPRPARPSAGPQGPGSTDRGRCSKEPSWHGALVPFVLGMGDPRLRAAPPLPLQDAPRATRLSAPKRPRACPVSASAPRAEAVVWAGCQGVGVARCLRCSAHTG